MFTSINPATAERIADYAALTDAQVMARLDLACDTFTTWRLSDPHDRMTLLRHIAEVFEDDRAALARIATQEMGKTLKSAMAEVEKCAAAFRYYARHGLKLLEATEVESPAGHVTARWTPLGPVLAVMPWNFPYWQVVRFAAPTIMAGNVGLLKHASSVQGCAAAIEAAVRKAGAPEGLFQNLAISSDSIAALIADDRVVAVTLTGSEGAGAKVAEAAGRALKKVVLELGGSDPFIVMPSADLDMAAKLAVTARTQNSGQSCICAKRIIVHADIYDAFMDKFVAGMQAVTTGDPMDPDTEMGPLSSFAQRDTVLDQLAKFRDAGARLLFGAVKPDLPGAYLTPGVLVDVDPKSDVADEEIFGPVAMVFKVDTIGQAIDLANATPFGLGSSVWTTDPAEQDRFARDIEAGMVAINRMLASTPEAPFGGVKRSGHGRELGPWGLHEFMNLKAVIG